MPATRTSTRRAASRLVDTATPAPAPTAPVSDLPEPAVSASAKTRKPRPSLPKTTPAAGAPYDADPLAGAASDAAADVAVPAAAPVRLSKKQVRGSLAGTVAAASGDTVKRPTARAKAAPPASGTPAAATPAVCWQPDGLPHDAATVAYDWSDYKTYPERYVVAGLATTTAIPDPLVLPPLLPDASARTQKVVSWNVASLNASFKKGLMRYLTAEMADIVCLQETKLRADPAPDSDLGTALGAHWPHQAWSHSAKPGYSGTAILSRTAPLAVETGLGSHAAETEGRVVACRFPDFVLVNVYVPNASEGLKRTGFKQAFLVALRAHVADLVQRWDPVGQRLLLVGDVNTCLYPTDLARPKTNIKTSGFSPDERRDYHDFLMGYPDAPSSESADRRSFEPLVDLYRRQHGPQAGGYTYYSYRFQARAKGLGWRLDAFLASRALADTLFKTIAVREDAYGASDHVPLIALLERTDPA